MTGYNTSGSIDIFSALQKLSYVPVIEDVSLADHEELRPYLKKLRQYFLHEKKTTDGSQISAAPVLVAPYLRNIKPESDYPAIYLHKSEKVTSLIALLREIFDDVFAPGEADSLANNLQQIVVLVQESLFVDEADTNYELQIKNAFKTIRKLDLEDSQIESFHSQCDRLETQLLTLEATLIAFSDQAGFEILNLQLQKRNDRNLIFLKKLKACISGLNDLLLLHGEKGDTTHSHFDFAEDLISFDKVDNIAVPSISSDLPGNRKKHIRECLQILTKAYDSYKASSSIIFVTNDLAREFSLKNTLSEARFEITKGKSCSRAKAFLKTEVDEFVVIIAAIRLADLEINQKYDADLHASYFEEFDISYLAEDDFQFLRTMIVIEEGQQLMQQPQDLLSLISDHARVKIFAINRLDDINAATGASSDDEDMYLELAALAIFRRNTYVFQGASDTPSQLFEAFNQGLNKPSPALWNILFPSQEAKKNNAGILELNAAIESRLFPRLVYDIRTGIRFGNHFDINANLQPAQSFPSFPLEVKTPSGEQTREYSMTMADYLAMNPNLLEKLEIVPAKYAHENLISLDEYLSATSESVINKLPFIWLVDEHNTLRQAVIPVSWIKKCRARLDYWQFIQEIGGVNSYHVQHTLEIEKLNWEAAKESEIQKIKEQLNSEFDRVRTNDLERAITRMVNSLLDPDKALSAPPAPTVASSVSTVSSVTEVSTAPTTEAGTRPEVLEKEQESIVSSEAWVEEDECTSCNDCTDALPGVFKYNSDKQATVHNPKGGSYAKIVAAAEKCPAACIHPGLPQNPEEPNLEKLIKRAEKFN
jgi:ferredoxin